jgi:hypothetical protein
VAQLHFKGVHYGWWDDTNGEPRYFWAGNKTDAHTCQCGIERNCHEGEFLCNCDSINSNVKLSDIGTVDLYTLGWFNPDAGYHITL